jgi:hypothetical protein
MGAPKAAVAARRARELAPRAVVRYAAVPFQLLPCDVLADQDLVVLASDNLAAELAVAEAARRHSIRVVQASLHGGTLTAEVRSIANAADDGPCLACSWAAEDWQRLDEGTRFACVPEAAAPLRQTVPTRTTPELCAHAATLAVAEVRRRSLALPAPPDVVLGWNGYTLRTIETRLARAAGCHADHTRWCVESRPRLAAATPWALARAARAGAIAAECMACAGGTGACTGGTGACTGGTGACGDELLARTVSLQMDGHVFARRASCVCGALERHDVFLPRGGGAACERCGARLAPGPEHWHEVPLDEFGAAAHRPLRKLLSGSNDAGEAPAVIVRCEGAAPVCLCNTRPARRSGA